VASAWCCLVSIAVRILYVDDDPDTLVPYAFVLGRCGADVAGVGSLTEGLDAFEKVRPAVLVADIGMPDGDDHAPSPGEPAREASFG
jgi:CheY-like chemotaxis protein